MSLKQLRTIKDSTPRCLCLLSTALWIKEIALGIKVVSKKLMEDEGLEMDFGLLMHFTFSQMSFSNDSIVEVPPSLKKKKK